MDLSVGRFVWIVPFGRSFGHANKYTHLDICRKRHILIWMREHGKPIVWLENEVKTPPFTREARIEAGILLRRLQRGESIGLPHSRPMPSIGRKCHELRIPDENVSWRIVYLLDTDAVVIGEVFTKKSGKTPKKVVDACRRRFRRYKEATR